MVDDVNLTLTAATPAVIAGERLPLEDTVVNLGDEPVEIGGSPDWPVYDLQTEDDRLPRFSRSAAEQLSLVVADARVPPMEPITRSLAAGASVSFDGDPAAYSNRPLRPGDYRIALRRLVDGEVLESNEVKVRVERPAIGHLTSLFCPLSGQQVQAFDHHDEDGRPFAFLRDDMADRAELGAFLRLGPIAGQGDVRGIAASTHLADSVRGRWVVALRGDTISAWQAWGHSLTARPPPLVLDMEAGLLVEAGFHVASLVRSHPAYDFGDGLFILAGLRRDAADRPATFVQLLRVTATEIVRVGDPLPLRGAGEPLPTRILAQATPTGTRCDLVWSDVVSVGAGPVTRIRSLAFDFDGQALSAATLLHEEPGPLLAFDMSGVPASGTPSTVQALFGRPSGSAPPDALTLCSIPVHVDAHTAVQRRDLSVPTSDVDHYAVSGESGGDPIVIAQSAGRLWQAAAANGSSWRLLRDESVPWRQLRVASSPDGYWAALGIDAELGADCIPDPDYSRE